jgi:Protein of unknown function (DUF2637)
MPPTAIPGTAAIRAAIGLLAAIGFALSYDALRQMAAAIHIRGVLTYAFPLVIDGFIAIGIGALIILRTAPLNARLYVWVLVGLATATSIWANALHAVRLNQESRHENGLHLDDATVGALSAIAPLALAGAVHLYLVIRRHPTERHNPPLRHNHPEEPTSTALRHTNNRHSQPTSPAQNSPRLPAAHVPENSKAAAPTTPQTAKTKTQGRQPSASIEELLAIGRTAPRGREGRISRRNVEAAIRAEGHTIGKDRLTEATRLLQEEADRHNTEPALTDA